MKRDGRQMSCIIVHGCPSNKEKAMDQKTRTHDKHWIPWLKKELSSRGIKTETPLMPTPWYPDYEKFKKEFERYDITKKTVLVGIVVGALSLSAGLARQNKELTNLSLSHHGKFLIKTTSSEKLFMNTR